MNGIYHEMLFAKSDGGAFSDGYCIKAPQEHSASGGHVRAPCGPVIEAERSSIGDAFYVTI